MTIDEVKAIQRDRNLLDVHVIELRQDGFTMAHTESERVRERSGGPALDECPIHEWLADCGGMPVEEPGLYTVTIEPVDGYSTSYRSIPYEFKPLASKEDRSSRIEVLPGTQSARGGPHPVHADEIESMDPEIWEASQSKEEE